MSIQAWFLATLSCNGGRPYLGSRAATLAHQETAFFFNCKPSEVVIGPSATALTFILSRAFSRLWGPPPLAVAERLAQVGMGVAAGHYYATMPMQALGLWPEGAVRASLAHYTTQTDLDKLVAGLQGSD